MPMAMISITKSLALGIFVLLFVFSQCDGQILGDSFKKISGTVANVTSNAKAGSTSAVHNIKDACGMAGECVKQNGVKVVNKTVTLGKEALNKIPIRSIADIINSAKCVIPKNADNILRASLLQQCVSPSLGFGNETRCFNELGCFSMENPWISNLRPFPQPMKPEEVDAKLYFYTRKQTKRYNVKLWPQISIEGSDFDPNREYTVFITHGFNSDGENQWMSDLKDAYLKQRDANVFLVDWGKGSKLFNYLQVASNTRIVGAELVRFGKYLIDHHELDPQKIHLMGHSLGAHISSYFSKGISGISRITAFDPAQPGFEGCPKEVRLDKSDAKFVDVIHTSCRPTVPFLGFGLISPVGHVDVYMNGGFIQPGCTVPPIDEVKLTSISDLAVIPADAFVDFRIIEFFFGYIHDMGVFPTFRIHFRFHYQRVCQYVHKLNSYTYFLIMEPAMDPKRGKNLVLGEWVACSHGRSFSYFTEALQNNCTFWAQKAKAFSTITNAVSIGQLQPILIKINKCKYNECVPLGLDIDQYPGRGVFNAGTAFFKPYCKSNLETDRLMRSEFQAARQNLKT